MCIRVQTKKLELMMIEKVIWFKFYFIFISIFCIIAFTIDNEISKPKSKIRPKSAFIRVSNYAQNKENWYKENCFN